MKRNDKTNREAETEKILVSVDDNVESERKLTFMNLDDNIWLQVFKYLHLIDAINLIRTCKRLKNLSRSSFKIKYKQFDMKHISFRSDEKIKEILNSIGPFIVDLTVQINHINKIVIDTCINVESLYIIGPYFDFSISTSGNMDYPPEKAEDLINWIGKLKLRKLEFRNCSSLHNLKGLIDDWNVE